MVAGGWARSHFFMVCWKRSTLPQVVGWLGREFFWRTPRRTSSFSRALRLVRPPWAKRVVNTRPLSVRVDQGVPWRSMACAERGEDGGSGDGAVGGDGQGVAGVVVEPGEDLGVGAVGESVVGEVGLPGLVGLFGLEPDVAGSGLLGGFGGDEPGPADDPVDRALARGRRGGGVGGARRSCRHRRRGLGWRDRGVVARSSSTRVVWGRGRGGCVGGASGVRTRCRRRCDSGPRAWRPSPVRGRRCGRPQLGNGVPRRQQQ